MSNPQTQEDAPLQPSATKTPESYVLPSAKALKAAGDVQLQDEHGNKFAFRDLYEKKGERQLIIFIRHFFCGSCEEYIRSLTPSLTPSTLASLSPPTRLTFIGSGAPDLIPRYRERTMALLRENGEAQYELYSDPAQGVYHALGMVVTLENPTTPPAYITSGYWSKVAEGFWGILSTLPKVGLATLKPGPPGQNGGEFLFDEAGKLVWSHRMQCVQDHCEVDELKEVLGMKG